MIGERLSHYRILEKIGAGGMGEVYRARDEHLGRDVAIKVLPVGTLADEHARKRFHKEAEALAKLTHPYIATVYEFDTQDGLDFLVMEYVAGATLREKLAQGPLPEKEVVQLGAQLAEGLAAAHERGVVHRDLKPGNIGLTTEGRVRVLDFGLAKLLQPVSEKSTIESLTEAPGFAGTLPYMPPEQLRGERVDPRSDIWSTGAVLYEMSSGRRPFPETLGPRLVEAILHQAPQPPRAVNRRISAALENIILKCLDKDPGRRYQSAKELQVDLERLSAPVPLVVAPAVRRGALARQGTVALAAGCVVLLALLLALNFGGLRDRLLGRAGLPRIQSLAVLPLENLSHNPEQEYFADGMTEALITELSKIGGLKVISRTSSMEFKGVKKPAPLIAGALGVDALIEGSVLREGDQVRITVQLIHGATDQHLWAESYQRELRSILTLQSEIARRIAKEIKIKLTPQQEMRLATAHVVIPQAHDAYLRGRYYWSKSTEDGLKKAIGYFNEAIERDPGYASGWAGLAESYAVLGDFAVVAPKETFPRAEAAAQRALELDDALAEAHAALGLVRLEYGWDWTAAEREFIRAIELNPSYPTAHQFYSWYLGSVLRVDESIAEGKRALELDPLSMFRSADLGLSLYMVRQYDRSREQAKKTLELDPRLDFAHWFLGLASVQKAMYEEAIAHLQEAATSPGASPRYIAGLGYAYAVAGKRNEARKILDKLNELSKQKYVSPYFTATVYAGLGDKEEAFEWLDKAYRDRDNWLAYVKVTPEFDPLHSDPRYQNLLRRMNFPG